MPGFPSDMYLKLLFAVLHYLFSHLLLNNTILAYFCLIGIVPSVKIYIFLPRLRAPDGRMRARTCFATPWSTRSRPTNHRTSTSRPSSKNRSRGKTNEDAAVFFHITFTHGNACRRAHRMPIISVMNIRKETIIFFVIFSPK